MVHMGFFVTAVIFGGLILIAILVNYVRNIHEHNSVFSTTLVVAGFILVSSPLWTAIDVRGSDWEINLVRESSEKQLENYLELVALLEKSLTPEQKKGIEPTLRNLEESLKQVRSEQESRDKRLQAIERATESVATLTTQLVTIFQ
jgi:hypothetical protein